MKAATNSTTDAIRAMIHEHRKLAAEIAKDQTADTAAKALQAAEQNLAAAEREDETIDPEDLVDRRIEAARQVEVAKIRLQRASKAQEERLVETFGPLIEARKIAAEELRKCGDPMEAAMKAGAIRVFGEDVVNSESRMFNSLVYQARQRLLNYARNIDQASYSNPQQTILDLEKAIELIEEALRDR